MPAMNVSRGIVSGEATCQSIVQEPVHSLASATPDGPNRSLGESLSPPCQEQADRSLIKQLCARMSYSDVSEDPDFKLPAQFLRYSLDPSSERGRLVLKCNLCYCMTTS